MTLQHAINVNVNSFMTINTKTINWCRRNVVLIRIALSQRQTLIETKNSITVTLLDCAMYEKCCGVERGRGICPVFSSPPLGIWKLKSPHPGNLPSKGKNATARGSAQGGGGAQLELTDA